MAVPAALKPFDYCGEFRRTLPAAEETYNPLTAIVDISSAFNTYLQCCRHANVSWLGSPKMFVNDLSKIGRLEMSEIKAVIAMAIAWTLFRYVLTWLVCRPFVKFWKMPPGNASKFPESVFKAIAYLSMWSCAVYVIFFRDHNFFNHSLQIWSNNRENTGGYDQQADLRLMYGLEASFYIHCIYGTLFMDHWRRDSIAMLLHHLVTLTLIGFAHTVGYWKIGVYIFLFDDIGDVCLELAKVCSYLRVKGGLWPDFWNNMSTFWATIFAATWTIFRNIFHLTKILRSAALGSFITNPIQPTPFWLFFNGLLSLLYMFYLYWFYFIVIFIYRVVSGTMKEVEDNREFEVEEQYTPPKGSKKQHEQQKHGGKKSD